MTGELIGSRARVWLFSLVATSVACGVAVFFGGELAFDPVSAHADAFSRSALGHRALVEWLRAGGRPVVVARSPSLRQLETDALLLILEPDIADARSKLALHAARERTGPTLVVLPKWKGKPDPEHPQWLAATDLRSAREPNAVLEELGVLGDVNRGVGDAEYAVEAPYRGSLSLPSPQTIYAGLDPLIVSSGDPGGMLLGSEGESLFVLSDPDALSNHGLARGENAAFVLSLLDRLAGADGPIVIDETIHGAALERELWRELLRPPLLPATISATLAFILLLLAGARRFGAPRAALPQLDPGKRVLIENTAALLRRAGNPRPVFLAYVRAIERDAGRALRLPESLSGEPLRKAVASQAAQAGHPLDIDEVCGPALRGSGRGAASEQAAVEAARRLWAWRRRLTRGAE